MASSREAVRAAAKEFVNFVNKSPSPFHAVDECRSRLLAAGFTELKETDHWDVKPKDKCFMTRNKSALIAFAVGGNYKPGNGFTIVGAHTDSPCLKVKPISRRIKQGYIQVGVETYGGGTWHTWFDRDLKVAGRVIVKNEAGLQHRLVNVNRPVMRVPNIAIHLQREMGQEFKFNKENHLSAVLATVAAEELENGTKSPDCTADYKCQSDKHHPVLVNLLAEELAVKPEHIMDFELCLADCNDATLGGAFNEFIFAPRLDNLLSSYCAFQSLIETCEGESLFQDTNIRMITLFDNEEIGSKSAQGAGSSLLEHILRRLSTGGTGVAFEEAIAKSLMLSCDVAHAVHPNYSDKHEEAHRPAFHKGLVLKFNANQSYATTAVTTALLRECAAKVNVPLQDFVVRQDMPCGSTIGPIMSANLGMPTVDVGAPLLSMHSIREMADISSIQQTVDLFKGFYENYPDVFESLKY